MKEKVQIFYPIENGRMNETNLILDFVFKEKLKIDCKEDKIMMGEKDFQSKVVKEKFLSELIEKYEFPFVNFTKQSKLSLFSVGLLSGVVCDIGNIASHVSTIEGYFEFNNFLNFFFKFL